MELRAIDYEGSDGWPLKAWVQRRSMESDEVVVLLHGGGPDHHSMEALGGQLDGTRRLVLPDIRGYGASACADPARHTWKQYAEDIVALLDRVGASRGILVGAGIGSTIALRAAVAYPERVLAMALISVEDIENDVKKEAEIAFMDEFAERAAAHGLEAAWGPILPALAPIIGLLVREAMPRSDRASIAAAAAIGRDRSFRSVDELAVISAPTLVFPGMDERHPAALAKAVVELLPNGRLATAKMEAELRSAEDFGRHFGPPIRDFLDTVALRATAHRRGGVV